MRAAAQGGGSAPAGGRPEPIAAGSPARRAGLTPLRIVLLYAATGVAWILLSDRALELFVHDPARLEELQTVKGAAYVCVTALLLHYLIRRNEQARRVQSEEVRAVFEGMADAVLVVDARRRIVGVNRAAVDLFRAHHERDLLVPLSDLVLRTGLKHIDGTPLTMAQSAMRRALAGEVVTAMEERFRAFDGKEMVVSVTAAPIRAGSGEPPRLAVAVVRDIAEEKRFEEMREEFLATAAHELRTPLAVVKAYAQLMRKRGQGDPAALDTIARQIDRLTRIVQQLLEVSRFRVCGAELCRERFDLAGLLAETADALREAAEAHRILVSIGAAAVVHADRERIGQVITSLIENAVRFSPQGGDVEAVLERRGAEAVVWVRDHGVGIAPERQGRVFERFYRAHAGTPHDYGGLGIGLDMSREIVARHGGRIWFESAPGEGSTFSFALPLAAEERAS